MGVEGLICISSHISIAQVLPMEEQALAVIRIPAPVYIQGNKAIHIKGLTV